MKLCKKLLAVLIAAAMVFTLCSAVYADEGDPTGPEIPEGYDGYAIMDVEVLPLGLGCILPPTIVFYHEGESVADLTMRFFEENDIAYEAGNPESFYLTTVEFPGLDELEINVPDYLMEQLIENYCYSEEDGWDQDEPENNMLEAGNYTYYSGWMYSDNGEDPGVGANECIVEEAHIYRWMYSIYGYGMDIGISDGWGMFPPFDNPAMGVDRSLACAVYSGILYDEELTARCSEGGDAYEYFTLFLNAFNYLGTTQDELDEITIALAFYLAGFLSTPGDVDGDGDVTVTDALLAMRGALGLMELDDAQYSAADYDGDGEVTVTDALLIMRTALGLI